MKQYIKALEHVLEKGKQREDRTGVGTRGVFGYQMRFDLRNSFPAVTTKKLAWKSVVSELLWFLEGSTDERRLAEIHFGKPREKIVDKKRNQVSGEIILSLYKGNITILSRKTKNKAYSMRKVSFEENKTFNKKKVENFIKFHSKQLNKG